MMRFGLTPLLYRRRVAFIWLAIFALLSHALMPPGLMAAMGLHHPGGDGKFTLCSAASESDIPGKAKPGVAVHHCALCTASAADLSRPHAGLMPACEIARDVDPRPGTDWAAAPLRHGRVQARAPPAMA